MKEMYNELLLEVIIFNSKDVIRASLSGNEESQETEILDPFA